MAKRYSNDYLTLMAKEADYGTAVLDYTASTDKGRTLPDKSDFKESTAKITTSQKTGTNMQNEHSILAGYKSVDVSLSGELTIGPAAVESPHDMLFQGFFSTATTPFTVPAIGTTPYSFTMFQAFGAEAVYNQVTSAVFQTLNISGSSGETIKYDATMRGQGITREVANADGTILTPNPPTGPVQPDLAPILFCSATMNPWLGNAAAKSFNSFQLSMTNTLGDDKSSFQNSCTRGIETYNGFSGTLSMEWDYDSTTDSTAYNNIVGTLVSTTIVLTGAATKTITLTMHGKISEYSAPDPDSGIFVGTATVDLLETIGGTDAISIATAYA